jgi:hypothetical protein
MQAATRREPARAGDATAADSCNGSRSYPTQLSSNRLTPASCRQRRRGGAPRSSAGVPANSFRGTVAATCNPMHREGCTIPTPILTSPSGIGVNDQVCNFLQPARGRSPQIELEIANVR